MTAVGSKYRVRQTVEPRLQKPGTSVIILRAVLKSCIVVGISGRLKKNNKIKFERTHIILLKPIHFYRATIRI